MTSLCKKVARHAKGYSHNSNYIKAIIYNNLGYISDACWIWGLFFLVHQ